jgi:hypothetical protein
MLWSGSGLQIAVPTGTNHQGEGSAALSFAASLIPRVYYTLNTTFVAFANVTRSGSASAWQNTANAQNSDDSRASLATQIVSGYTDYLRASNLADKLPAGAIIDGITVTIERQDEAGVTVDSSVMLVVDGTAAGTDKADGSTSWLTSDTNAVYGSGFDLWGLSSITRDQINGSTFGVEISANVGAGVVIQEPI